MNFDITQVPFSCRGSYLALSQNEGEFGGARRNPGSTCARCAARPKTRSWPG